MMSSETFLAKLRRSLIQHEGYSKFPYVDTVGKITIGIGYNLSDRGMDDEWIDWTYAQDVAYFMNKLISAFPWFSFINLDRKIVLVDMVFNLGWNKFMTFTKLHNACLREDYEDAAKEMLDSEWAKQVKGRAIKLSDAMKTGTYNI